MGNPRKHVLGRVVALGSAVVVCVLAVSSGISVGVYIVAKDGTGDFTTIQAAADIAQAGDTVLVRAGTYAECVEPMHSGTAGAYISYRSYPGDEVIIDGEEGTRDVCIFVEDRHYLRFEGLKLAGAYYAGFYSEGPASNLMIEGLTIENHFNPARSVGYGIWFIGWNAPVQDCEIRGCEISRNSAHGVFLYRRCYDILIEGNHVSYSGTSDHVWGHNVKAVVWNEDDPATGPVGITIAGNELDHAATQGIMTWNARDVWIRDNHCHHNGATGIQIEDGTENFVVENNLCEHNQLNYSTETGIWIDDARYGVVRNNVLRHNQVGIKVSKCKKIIVRNNLIYRNSEPNEEHLHNGGIILLAYDDITNRDICVVHNTFHRIGNPDYVNVAISFFDYYGSVNKSIYFLNNIISTTVSGYEIDVECDSTDSLFLADYNDYYNEDPLRVYWQDTELTWEQYQSISGQDSNSIHSYPLFADTFSDDYHLQESSPCVDSGCFLTEATTSGTVIPVENALFFTDGYGVVEGDSIVIGSRAPVKVCGVDYESNLVTIEESISWTAGDGVSYTYSGSAPDIGALEFRGVTSVEDGPSMPSGFTLFQNYPNPFNPCTTIRYSLPWAAEVSLRIYGVRGELVRVLMDERQDAGIKEVVWDGRDKGGRSVASGIYFYRLRAGDVHEMKKLVLMK